VLNAFNPLVRSGWRRAGVIIVQNEETRSRLPRRYRSKTVVRCNSVVGPDLDEMVDVQPRPTSTSEPRALLAGRLRDWKGGTLAIRALPRTRTPWRLDIVGEGRSESKLRALVTDLGVGDRVTFTPWVSRTDLWRRMHEAAALVLPSLRDDAPLIVAEAQALGVPVVALDQGGPAVMAAEPTASVRLVPVADPETAARGLASALDRIASEPPERRPNTAFGLAVLAAFVDATYERAAK
jgi:glycosyltransferase involved in cell wall biosynthesis